MKKIFTLSLILSFPFMAGAQWGVETSFILGSGYGQMQKTVGLHGGVGGGFFYSLPSVPLSLGWRVAGNSYGCTEREDMPFYADDYVHQVARISNVHNITLNNFYVRYELNHKGGLVPFAELGGGWAKYKTRWSAVDPFEQSNDDCEGYLESGKVMVNRTPSLTASAGLTFKFNRWGNRNNCSGFWLTVAADYSRGSQVTHLNSKLNPQQFNYDNQYKQPAVVSDVPRPRHGSHQHTVDTPAAEPEMTDDQYLAQPQYKARHELLQCRITLTWFFGGCK